MTNLSPPSDQSALIAALRQQIEDLHADVCEKNMQLSRRDEQIIELTRALDHAQQLHGLAQKNISMLAEQLDSSRQMIEDMRQRRSWWQFWKRG